MCFPPPTSARSRLAVRALLATSIVAALVAVATPAAAHSPTTSGTTTTSGTPATSSSSAAGDALACPIPDGSEFVDSWGARRSGGRRHQGVDMIAPRGTPIAAVRAGEVQFKRSRLGGNAVWLTTDDGDRYYYAHLEDFAGESRTVAAGEVIGYVGSSGNAKGPHLHFETHPGGSAENPYDATFQACVQPTIDALHALDAIRRGAQFDPAPGDVDAALVATRVTTPTSGATWALTAHAPGARPVTPAEAPSAARGSARR